MIAKCYCQQCGQPFEFDVEQQMAFVDCPNCGKQTRLIAEEQAPTLVPEPVLANGEKASVWGLEWVSVLLGLIGFVQMLQGCMGQSVEAMSKEGSALRQALAVNQSGFGCLMIAGSAIIYALTRIIKK